MPGADGFEFATAVRETNKEIPILFVTARDDFMSKRMGYGIGIDDYMVKPIDLDELNLKIGALLRRAKIAVSKKLLSASSFLMRRSIRHITVMMKFSSPFANSTSFSKCFHIRRKLSPVHSLWMNFGMLTPIQAQERLMFI